MMKSYSGDEAELFYVRQEEQALFQEVFDWLLSEEATDSEKDAAFKRFIQLQREQSDVAFSTIARACEVESESPARLMRAWFFDLLRRRGIKIVPNMNCEKLFNQYRQLRAKSAA